MFYTFAKSIVWFILSLIYRVEVRGAENIPKDDGAIICPNHYFWLDPPLVAVFMPRKVRPMAKQELFDKHVLGFILRKLGAFPVKRGEGDLNAIKTTLKTLKDKQLVLLFPEGTRIKGGKLGKANPGVAMLSIKSGKPAIPVLIQGSYKLFSRMIITIGEPVDFIKYKKDRMTNDDYVETSQIIMSKIKELGEER